MWYFHTLKVASIDRRHCSAQKPIHSYVSARLPARGGRPTPIRVHEQTKIESYELDKLLSYVIRAL